MIVKEMSPYKSSQKSQLHVFFFLFLNNMFINPLIIILAVALVMIAYNKKVCIDFCNPVIYLVSSSIVKAAVREKQHLLNDEIGEFSISVV